MTKDEKAAALAEAFGWRRLKGGVADFVQSDGTLMILGYRGWHPFDDIVLAKMVQEEMLNRGYCTGTDARLGGGWFAYFEKELLEESAGIARPTEAEAICEAAGRVLGLWKEDASDEEARL